MVGGVATFTGCYCDSASGLPSTGVKGHSPIPHSPSPLPLATPPGRSHYNAKPTEVEWPSGEVIRFPSKTEACVARRLLEEVSRTPGARLYRQVRIPLLSGAPDERGRPLPITVDFAVVHEGRVRLIDAKTKKRNREWRRGRSLAGAIPGWVVEIEEVER